MSLRGTELAGTAPGSNGVRIDRPGDDRRLAPWHQEFQYQFRSLDGMTFWLPLVPVTDEMGPVVLARGSHRGGVEPLVDTSGTGEADMATGAYGGLRLADEATIPQRYELCAPVVEPGRSVRVRLSHAARVGRERRRARALDRADPLLQLRRRLRRAHPLDGRAQARHDARRRQRAARRKRARRRWADDRRRRRRAPASSAARRAAHPPTVTTARLSISSTARAIAAPTIVYVCEVCAHVQTPPLDDIGGYYDTAYNVHLESDDADDLYAVRDGVPVYRAQHQANVALAEARAAARARRCSTTAAARRCRCARCSPRGPISTARCST